MKNLLDDFKSTLNENYNILNNIPPTEFALKYQWKNGVKKKF